MAGPPDISSEISIHTPHAGSDSPAPSASAAASAFQSTLPMRGATMAPSFRRLFFVFQSTLPMRGATGAVIAASIFLGDFNPHSPCGERPARPPPRRPGRVISIHTPHAGSDDTADLFVGIAGAISIHTPHAGSDVRQCKQLIKRRISIHTPHAGSDFRLGSAQGHPQDFNPHSPCGERRDTAENIIFRNDFNPHSPCGERRVSITFTMQDTGISIHTPHAGSDSSMTC